jgi:hypothetical protein
MELEAEKLQAEALAESDDEKPVQVVENLEIDVPEMDMQELKASSDKRERLSEPGEAVFEMEDAEANEGEEEEELDEDMIQFYSEIPNLEEISEEAVDDFKTKMIEHIFRYQIFNSEEFDSLFEATYYKNNSVDYELLEKIFEEIADIIQEKLEEFEGYEMGEEEMEGEDET